MSNVTISVPKSNFEVNFCTYVFGKCFWHFTSRKLVVEHRDIYYAKKNIKKVWMYVFRIYVYKWNIYETHIFQGSFVETCWLEKTSLCLNTRLSIKKISKIS
jgi:hypothetical protein